jgi:hypothetical protein
VGDDFSEKKKRMTRETDDLPRLRLHIGGDQLSTGIGHLVEKNLAEKFLETKTPTGHSACLCLLQSRCHLHILHALFAIASSICSAAHPLWFHP